MDGGNGVRIGVDIGGTKTHLRICGPGPVREHILPSGDWRQRGDWGADARALLGLCHALADGAPVAALGVGAHGCDSTQECTDFQAALAALAGFPVAVVNDAELMPLAVGKAGEVGVVAGTGSIAVHRTEGGDLMVAGGWGWQIGDEGSSASLVREAVRAVARHLDCGHGEGDPLVGAIFAALGEPTPARLGSTLAEMRSAAEVGRHAGAVFEAAEQGSALAAAVIDGGGAALAELVCRLRLRGVRPSCAIAGGGVITRQPRLWNAFAASLRRDTEGAVTSLLFTGAPVTGACNLAAALPATVACDPSD